MKFIDSIEIRVKAGRGGDGIVSFLRSKGKPKLGPDGGDGGTGGAVIMVGTRRLNTLSSLRFRAIYSAQDGGKGGSNRCRGKCGDDLLIPVPVGTVVFDEATGEKIGELLDEGEELLVANGGRHGLGNIHWVKSTHQAPEEFRPGGPGEERDLKLELKLLADVGLAGFPNAGKSTLLSRVSAARPKIADYPFTTLVPNLGVVELKSDDYQQRAFVMADVPGLIEGASEGRGLGLQFLKHLERTSVIAYMIDVSDAERSPAATLEILQDELSSFGPDLATKRSLVILTKCELIDSEALQQAQAELAAVGHEALVISAVTGQGLTALKDRLYALVSEIKMQSALTAEPAESYESPSNPY
ncbi:MAG: GTPase ObgE [Pseudomonadota bacterium]|jgi:GTP-binding protein